jgi:heptaprenyl diphosphate synthase
MVINMQLESITNNEILKSLEKVKENIDKSLIHGDKFLNGSLSHVKAATGKMLRPLLLLIGSSFGKDIQKEQNNIIKLAAAIEMIHMASLIHDDIIDEAKLRRGQESIQSKYSKSYAVFMGDFLLSQSFLLIGELEIEKSTAVLLAKAVNKICIGEMKQYKWRYDMSITPRAYLRIVTGKTAALISASLSAGAYYCGAKEEVTRTLARIGYEIGMAFQVVDDLLDYVGNEEAIGKEVQKDLIRGNYSIPVIFAIQSKKGKLIKELLQDRISSKDDSDQIIRLIKESGALDKTKSLAMRYTEKALKFTEKLPESEGKESLKNIIPQLLERVY